MDPHEYEEFQNRMYENIEPITESALWKELERQAEETDEENDGDE
jgi:hypothetical protein